jgi:hypothetical protein
VIELASLIEPGRAEHSVAYHSFGSMASTCKRVGVSEQDPETSSTGTKFAKRRSLRVSYLGPGYLGHANGIGLCPE